MLAFLACHCALSPSYISNRGRIAPQNLCRFPGRAGQYCLNWPWHLLIVNLHPKTLHESDRYRRRRRGGVELGTFSSRFRNGRMDTSYRWDRCVRPRSERILTYHFTLAAVNATLPNVNLTGAPLVLGQDGTKSPSALGP